MSLIKGIHKLHASRTSELLEADRDLTFRPKVAVLLAAYRGSLWLDEQVNSILDQADVDVHIFISVDPSPDETLLLCSRLAALRSDISLLPEIGPFGSAGRNFFRLIRDVQLEGYDYVAFADQDDIWFSNKLARAALIIQKERCGAYSSNVIAFWPDGTRRLIHKAQPQVEWDYLFEAAGPGCTYVFPAATALELQVNVRENWKQLQLVTLHDWYFYAYVRSVGKKWFIDCQPGVLYRQHLSNQVGANVGLRSLIKRAALIRGGWWLTQVKLIATLVGASRTPIMVLLNNAEKNRCRLILSASKCRRRIRDRLTLALIFALSAR